MGKRLAIPVLAALLAAAPGGGGLGAQAGTGQTGQALVVRIGNAFTGGRGRPFAIGTLGVADQRGLLEKELAKDGIKVEWDYFKGISAAVNEAFANDSIDFAATSDLGAIIGRGSGLKIKLIAAGTQPRVGGAYIAVPIDSDIKTVKDLKGKRVATANASNFQLELERVLQLNGLSRDDIQYYNMGPAEGVAALGAKGIDAALYGGAGQLFVAVKLGLAKIIYSIQDDKAYPDKWKPVSGLFVSEKFAKAHPDVVLRVLKVYLETAKWGSEPKNRQQWFEYSSKTGVALDEIIRAQEKVPLKRSISPLMDELYLGHIKDTIEFAAQRELIRKAFNLDEFVDRSFLDQALKELKLAHYWDSYNAEGDEKIAPTTGLKRSGS